jgi:hypothetical protein
MRREDAPLEWQIHHHGLTLSHCEVGHRFPRHILSHSKCHIRMVSGHAYLELVYALIYVLSQLRYTLERLET